MGCRLCKSDIHQHSFDVAYNFRCAKGITKKHLKGHNAIVFCVNYNTNGNLLVSGDVDGQVKIWNASKGVTGFAGFACINY